MNAGMLPIDALSAGAVPTDFQFLRPLWLLGLLALPLLLWWLRGLRQRRNAWRDAVDAHLLPHLLQDAQAGRGAWRARLSVAVPAMAFAIALLALAGPSWRQVPQPLWQDRNPLVIAVDLSSATLADDVQPSRLLQARAKIGRILSARGGGQIGLVAFADDAYTVSPLTDDAGNVALFLEALSPDVMPRDGSRADHAIEESVRLLERAGFGRGDILLITDRAGGSAASAATSARRAGYRVSVLGLGTEAGGAYRERNGRPVQVRLEGAALRALAAAGGGGYAPVAATDADLQSLGVLTADRIDAAAAQGKRGTAPLDEGFWLLPLLLLLVLPAFRRGVLAVALLAMCLPWQTATAADGSLWQRADQREYAQMQRGVEAYRAGDFAAAETALRDLPGPEAAYNRGNALAKQGRYDEAIAAYDDALRQRPGMVEAAENRRRVEAARKRPPQDKPQNQPQKQQQQSPNDPQNKPQKPQNDQQRSGPDKPSESNQGPKQQPKPDAKRDPQRDNPPEPQGVPPKPQPPPQTPPASPSKPDPQRGQPQPGKPQQGQPSQGKPQPGKPDAPPPAPQTPQGTPAPPAKQPDDPETRQAEAERQRQADAAQRERMRRAQAKPQDAPASAPKRQLPGSGARETDAQRERRLANEAMLRRVPDDPGGLLRAKFRLEDKRRRREGDR